VAGPLQDVMSPVCLSTAGGSCSSGSAAIRFSREGGARGARRRFARLDSGRGAWPTMTVEERIHHVRALHGPDAGAARRGVKLLMWEIASRSRFGEEFDRTIVYIRDTIDALKDLDRASSRLVIEKASSDRSAGAARRVLCMGPFNYPLNETSPRSSRR